MFGAPLDCLRPTRRVPAAQLRVGERVWGQTQAGTAIVTVRGLALYVGSVAADTDAGAVWWRRSELVDVVLPELEVFGGDDAHAVVHTCECGHAYTGETWGRLAGAGCDEDAAGRMVDRRECGACGGACARVWCGRCGAELPEGVGPCPACDGGAR